MTPWAKKSASLYTVGRKLEDGAMYILDLEDMYPAGVLVQAYKQETSDRYTLSVSEGELGGAGLSRSRADLERLAESIDIYHVHGRVFIHSTFDGIVKPKIVPTGDQARAFVEGMRAGTGSLEELLTTALSELCKVKPEGLDAVRWLAEWLLVNNPNKPKVVHADDERDGGEDGDEGGGGETALGDGSVVGMVATVESRLQEE
ncbi:unnamed protein product [Ectocarpus sp. 12 AP-2014]